MNYFKTIQMKPLKYYLCTCNACDNVLIDEDHSVSSELYQIPDNGVQIQSIEMIEIDEATGNWFWGCPFCKSDADLIDNISLEEQLKLNVIKVN